MSDIPTPAVSPNDPIRDIASLEADAISEGYAEGFADGRAEVLPILADLISDLRAYARYTYTEYTLIENALDRAETRLMSLNKGHKDTDPVQCDARNASDFGTGDYGDTEGLSAFAQPRTLALEVRLLLRLV